MAGRDPIDEYVDAVARGLRGSRRLRADMLAEIRDALVDAAEAEEQDRDVPAPESRRRAVTGFGPAADIAAGLQDVLAFTQARRTAWGLLAVLGTRHLISLVSGRAGLWDRWWDGARPGTGYTMLSHAVQAFVLACLVLAGLAVVVFGRGTRMVEATRSRARAVAVAAPVALGLALVAGLLLTGMTPGGSAHLDAVLVSTAWWLAPFALVLRAARRCWQAGAARHA